MTSTPKAVTPFVAGHHFSPGWEPSATGRRFPPSAWAVQVKYTPFAQGKRIKNAEEMIAEIKANAKKKWLQEFLALPNGIPSHDTFGRVFCAMNNKLFAESFRNWTEGLRKKVSGEIDSASPHPGGLPSAVCLPSVGCRHRRQNATAQSRQGPGQEREADADYVLALKGNRETALEEVSSFLLDAKDKDFKGVSHDFLETVEKDHGRIETRRYLISEEIGWFQDRPLCEGLKGFGMVESLRDINGVVTREVRFFLSSLAGDAKNFGRAVRGHWSVENSLPWSLDVCFAEDTCRIRAGYTAENMAILRHMTINVLKNDTSKKRGIKGKQKNAAWDHSWAFNAFALTLPPFTRPGFFPSLQICPSSNRCFCRSQPPFYRRYSCLRPRASNTAFELKCYETIQRNLLPSRPFETTCHQWWCPRSLYTIAAGVSRGLLLR